MKRIEEPLTTAQRKELQEISSTTAVLARAGLFLIAVFLMGIIFRLIQHALLSSPPLWIVPTIGAGVWLYVRAGRWTGGRNLRRRAREDLKAGDVLITVIEPISVVEIEELEDEGPSYVIETTDNEMVLLTGQEMARYKRKKFPWSKIGVIEAPRSKMFFGLKRLGDPISVEHVVSALSYDDVKKLGCFNENFIVLDEEKRNILRLAMQGT